MLQPLTDALKGDPKTLEWPPPADAFQAAKGTLVAAVPLAQPAQSTVLSLAMDASDTHVGSVLQQLATWKWPLAFYSRSCQGWAPGIQPSTESCWPIWPRRRPPSPPSPRIGWRMSWLPKNDHFFRQLPMRSR